SIYELWTTLGEATPLFAPAPADASALIPAAVHAPVPAAAPVTTPAAALAPALVAASATIPDATPASTSATASPHAPVPVSAPASATAPADKILEKEHLPAALSTMSAIPDQPWTADQVNWFLDWMRSQHTMSPAPDTASSGSGSAALSSCLSDSAPAPPRQPKSTHEFYASSCGYCLVISTALVSVGS
ncbi:unnamed protein product, partial [Tilletia laevis]